MPDLKTIKKPVLLLFLIATLFQTPGISAQGNDPAGAIELQVTAPDSTYSTGNVISSIVKIKNRANLAFKGYFILDLPETIRTISSAQIPLTIAAGDSLFIPVKSIIKANAQSGRYRIGYEIRNLEKKTIIEKNRSFTIAEKEQINLFTEDRNIFYTDRNDSVRVRTRVVNGGNKEQTVRIVFSIPELTGERNFIEQQAVIQPQESRDFSFSFIPSRNLLGKQQYTVNISALKGNEKVLFGNASVTVQNVSSNQSYMDNFNQLSNQYYGGEEYLTAIYRSFGKSETYQLLGNKSINLPAGYLNLTGNIYKMQSQDEMYASNTTLSYRWDNNEFSIGNISESTEISLYGRGAKVSLADNEKNKTIQFGVIDVNYNLFSSTPLFDNEYSLYLKGNLGKPFANNSGEYIYVYNNDPLEKTVNHLAGGGFNWRIDPKWNVVLKAYAALSNFSEKNYTSGSTEFQYRGTLKTLTINGSLYYSTPYYPGSRRGATYIQQTISKKFNNDYTLFGNLYYSKYAPKYRLYESNSKYQSAQGEVGIRFPKINRVTPGLGFQSQYESSNSYRSATDTQTTNDLTLTANRLTEQLYWSSPNHRHSVSLLFENGLVKYSREEELNFQFKANATYSYDWLSLNLSLQRGSYYTSEYMISRNMNKTYQRFIASVNMNKDLFKQKLNLNASAYYMNDIISGSYPSATLNLKYNPSRSYSLFINYSWYQYNYFNYKTENVNNIEVGFTFHFPGRIISSKRKSRIKANIYYDRNENNRYDEGDEPAKGYGVTIDKMAFISNEKGEFSYSNVPRGKYQVNVTTDKGWFSPSVEIEVDKMTTKLVIPLKQMGTAMGSIKYEADELSAEFNPKYAGLHFIITNNTNTFSRNAYTMDDGTLSLFLPTGNYEIELDHNSLSENTSCSNSKQQFSVKSGEITKLSPFIITVKKKQINFKRFVQNI